MKIKGLGVDIIEIERVRRAADNPFFLKKLFTEKELKYFQSRNMNIATIAGSFAAKEAYIKAIDRTGVSPKSVQVLRDGRGKPYITSDDEGLRFFVSISHCRDFAVAEVIAVSCED